MNKRRLWLCLPPTFVGLIDLALTLWYQSPEYWAGNYLMAHEANPLLVWLMRVHPLAFDAMAVAWLLFLWYLFFRLPRAWSRLLCVCVTLGHACAASTWLGPQGEIGYWLNIALAVASGLVLLACLDRAAELEPEKSRPQMNTD